MRDEPHIRTNLNKIVNGWFCKRSPLLTAVWQLNGLPPYDKSAVAMQAVLRNFCQDLMDYASEGHFRVFEQIIAALENKVKPADLQLLLKRISHTTETMVDFNDAFDNHENLAKHRNFATFLSVIGETLAQRFELEDELIKLWEQTQAHAHRSRRA